MLWVLTKMSNEYQQKQINYGGNLPLPSPSPVALGEAEQGNQSIFVPLTMVMLPPISSTAEVLNLVDEQKGSLETSYISLEDGPLDIIETALYTARVSTINRYNKLQRSCVNNYTKILSYCDMFGLAKPVISFNSSGPCHEPTYDCFFSWLGYSSQGSSSTKSGATVSAADVFCATHQLNGTHGEATNSDDFIQIRSEISVMFTTDDSIVHFTAPRMLSNSSRSLALRLLTHQEEVGNYIIFDTTHFVRISGLNVRSSSDRTRFIYSLEWFAAFYWSNLRFSHSSGIKITHQELVYSHINSYYVTHSSFRVTNNFKLEQLNGVNGEWTGLDDLDNVSKQHWGIVLEELLKYKGGAYQWRCFTVFACDLNTTDKILGWFHGDIISFVMDRIFNVIDEKRDFINKHIDKIIFNNALAEKYVNLELPKIEWDKYHLPIHGNPLLDDAANFIGAGLGDLRGNNVPAPVLVQANFLPQPVQQVAAPPIVALQPAQPQAALVPVAQPVAAHRQRWVRVPVLLQNGQPIQPIIQNPPVAVANNVLVIPPFPQNMFAPNMNLHLPLDVAVARAAAFRVPKPPIMPKWLYFYGTTPDIDSTPLKSTVEIFGTSVTLRKCTQSTTKCFSFTVRQRRDIASSLFQKYKRLIAIVTSYFAIVKAQSAIAARSNNKYVRTLVSFIPFRLPLIMVNYGFNKLCTIFPLLNILKVVSFLIRADILAVVIKSIIIVIHKQFRKFTSSVSVVRRNLPRPVVPLQALQYNAAHIPQQVPPQPMPRIDILALPMKERALTVFQSVNSIIYNKFKPGVLHFDHMDSACEVISQVNDLVPSINYDPLNFSAVGYVFKRFGPRFAKSISLACGDNSINKFVCSDHGSIEELKYSQPGRYMSHKFSPEVLIPEVHLWTIRKSLPIKLELFGLTLVKFDCPIRTYDILADQSVYSELVDSGVKSSSDYERSLAMINAKFSKNTYVTVDLDAQVGDDPHWGGIVVARLMAGERVQSNGKFGLNFPRPALD